MVLRVQEVKRKHLGVFGVLRAVERFEGQADTVRATPATPVREALIGGVPEERVAEPKAPAV